jgi:hypothetical protein
MFSAVVSIPPDVEIQRQLTSMHIDEWMRDDIFHFRWWLLLILLTASIFIWWKAIDKSRLPEILLYAALTTIIAMAINEYGEELTLWDYPVDIIPIFPPLSSINLISLPLIYSITYQRFKGWKNFIRATLIITCVICFIIEPLLVWGEFYQLLKWKHYFSYPIYAATALCIRFVVIKIYAVTEKYKKEHDH